MNDCVFCKIIRGEISAEKIHEDDDSLSFLDINPVNEGHVLIIPKDHYDNILETPDNIICSLFQKAKQIMKAVKTATGADFVTLSVVGIDIPHFHIHLVPRFQNDGLKNFWPAKKYESVQKIKEVGEKIRKEIN